MEPTKQEFTVARSDLEKVHDALVAAVRFHEFRDRMNAALHHAAEVRFSPLTSTLAAERDRVQVILEEGS